MTLRSTKRGWEHTSTCVSGVLGIKGSQDPWDFPCSPVVKTLSFQCPGARLQSLVGDLRPYMPCGLAKVKKKKRSQDLVLYQSPPEDGNSPPLEPVPTQKLIRGTWEE